MRLMVICLCLGALAACAWPPGRSTPGAPATPESAALPDTAKLPSPTPPAASAPTRIPQPTRTPGPAVERRNLFETILGEVELPAGWTASACPGRGDVLCFFKDGRLAGGLELHMTLADNHPDLVLTLRSNGLRPGPLNLRLQRVRVPLLAGLRELALDYLEDAQQARQGMFPAGVKITLHKPLQSQVGALPGMRFGFLAAIPGAETQERALRFIASDGEVVYNLAAVYPTGGGQPFLVDDDLALLERAIRNLVAGLKIPLPVQSTQVTIITARRDVPIYGLYGAGPPVGALLLGESAPVTGLGVDGSLWRVACPEDPARNCWISADPAFTQSSTR